MRFWLFSFSNFTFGFTRPSSKKLEIIQCDFWTGTRKKTRRPQRLKESVSFYVLPVFSLSAWSQGWSTRTVNWSSVSKWIWEASTHVFEAERVSVKPWYTFFSTSFSLRRVTESDKTLLPLSLIWSSSPLRVRQAHFLKQQLVIKLTLNLDFWGNKLWWTSITYKGINNTLFPLWFKSW